MVLSKQGHQGNLLNGLKDALDRTYYEFDDFNTSYERFMARKLAWSLVVCPCVTPPALKHVSCDNSSYFLFNDMFLML